MQKEESLSKYRGRRIHFLDALSSVNVPYELLTGVPVHTVSMNGKTQPVSFLLSPDRFTLFLRRRNDSRRTGSGVRVGQLLARIAAASSHNNSDSNTNEISIDIGEIERVQRGQSTQKFEFAKKQQHLNFLNSSSNSNSNSNSNHHAVNTSSNNNNNNTTNIPPSASNDSNSPTTTSSISTATLKKAELRRDTSGSSHSSALALTLDPAVSFSIIFLGGASVDLMASSKADRNRLCSVLDALLVAYQRGKTRVSQDVLLLRYVWLQVDRQKTGFCTAQQMGHVLQAMSFFALQRPKDVAAAYEKFGKVIGLSRQQRRTGLTFEQSATFLHKIKRDSWLVKPVNFLWGSLFGELMNNGKARMTVSDKTFLERFLHQQQGQTNATLTEVRKLFHRLHNMEFAHMSKHQTDLHRINKDQFEAYLLAPENDAFNPERSAFHEDDMHRPLSEYFINSSHNTYLIGHQYTSHSSVEMYSNALYRGARCIELDIWDGQHHTDGTPVPVVWHGGTWTTKIRFSDVIKTIKVFLNFHPDTYPIVLSFENHCSIPFQQVMAEKLVKILGDSLYIPTEASLFGELPSPHKLRGMVVIKGRRPLGTEADQYDSDDDSETETSASSYGGDFLTTSMSAAEAVRARELMEARDKVLQHGVAVELARLTLFHGHKWKSFPASKETRRYFMHSFSENRVKRRCRQKLSQEWIEYNQTHMSRTYPAGSRLESSNFNPLLSWSVGCQMAALNFQTEDSFLQLNDGRFRQNGNCGYVLKPSVLMAKKGGENRQRATKLNISVLSGSCLPKPKGARMCDCIDPYVKVAVYDVKNGEKETVTQFSTGVVLHNGLFPIWEQEFFPFTVENWAVAMLQVTVFDKQRDEFIAVSSIPVSCLRRGIRCVKLYDSTNARSGAFDFASVLLDVDLGNSEGEI